MKPLFVMGVLTSEGTFEELADEGVGIESFDAEDESSL